MSSWVIVNTRLSRPVHSDKQKLENRTQLVTVLLEHQNYWKVSTTPDSSIYKACLLLFEGTLNDTFVDPKDLWTPCSSISISFLFYFHLHCFLIFLAKSRKPYAHQNMPYSLHVVILSYTWIFLILWKFLECPTTVSKRWFSGFLHGDDCSDILHIQVLFLSTETSKMFSDFLEMPILFVFFLIGRLRWYVISRGYFFFFADFYNSSDFLC